MLYSPPDSRCKARREASTFYHRDWVRGVWACRRGRTPRNRPWGYPAVSCRARPVPGGPSCEVNPSVSPMRADPRLHSALAIVGVHIPVCGSTPSGGDRFLTLLVLAIFFSILILAIFLSLTFLLLVPLVLFVAPLLPGRGHTALSLLFLFVCLFE